MSGTTREALLARLRVDGDVRPGTIETFTDTAASVGSDVCRLVWRDQVTTAVDAEASLATTCGALLDAIALSFPNRWAALDTDVVNVLIDRFLPGDNPSETDQAVRSIRDAADGSVRVWYRDGDRWTEDLADAPTWPADRRVAGWVRRLLLPRLTAEPTELALALVDAVADPSLQLYPSEITRTVNDVWAVRADGLEIGTVGPLSGVLRIGRAGPGEESAQRAVFREVFGGDEVTVVPPGGPLGLTTDDAGQRIRALLERFRGTPVVGAPVTHRSRGGAPFVDEHALEARLLKGLLTLGDDRTELVLDDARVARGSQFPTLWGHGGPPRYLDALIRRGRTPIAVELKVATGGQGRYYRRAITQAVLYRHFIVNSPDLDPWFDAAGLDRLQTEAVVGLPIPDKLSSSFADQLDSLRAVAARVGVRVELIDDRVAPDRSTETDGPDLGAGERDRLTWRLAGALSARWPRTLGNAFDLTEGGGQYDMVCLGVAGEVSIDWPIRRPRVHVNRSGSLWVLNQVGEPRWTWRSFREELAGGLDEARAAEIVGRMAGLWPPERPDPVRDPERATFCELASRFLDLVDGDGDWRWENAWLDVDVRPWLARFAAPVRRYSRSAPIDRLPTIARIWGAVRDGEAHVIVDQQNLRVWQWTLEAPVEITDPDRFARIERAARPFL